MERASLKTEETLSLNVVPLIDVMFNLLLFLMVATDMSQHSLANVKLPQATTAQEEKEKKSQQQLLINVVMREDTQGRSLCPAYPAGGPCSDETQWEYEVAGHRQALADLKSLIEVYARQYPAAGKGKLSDAQVMVWADRLAPYRLVQTLYETCARYGIYQIKVGARKLVQR